MSREVDDYFDEIDTKIPEDVSRLVEKQMDIAEAIAGAIERSEFKTRKAFAAAIGMKESMLSRILAGNVNLTLKTITKIESALNTDIISVKTPKTKPDLEGLHQPDIESRPAKYSSGRLIVPSIAAEGKTEYSNDRKESSDEQ